MNIQNMHIAVRQGVDKINSLQADSLLSEEIDLELNKNMGRFINLKYGKNNQYGKGFEESQKRIDDLSTLITEHRGFTGFIDREGLGYYKGKYLWREFYELPFNYMHHIESSCNSLRGANCQDKNFKLEFYNDADYISNQDYEDNVKFFIIPWADLQGDGGYAKSKFTIERGVEIEGSNSEIDENLGNTATYLSGGPSKKAIIWEMLSDNSLLTVNEVGILNIGSVYKNYIVNHILNNHSDEVSIKWEKSGTKFYSDSFVVIIKPNSDLYKWVRTEEEASQIADTLADAGNSFNDEGDWQVGPAGDSSISHFESFIRIGVLSTPGVGEDNKIKLEDTEDLVGYKRKFANVLDTINASDAEGGGKNTSNTYWSKINDIGREFEGVNTSITYIQHDDLHAMLKDPFNRPSKESILGIFTNKRIELFTLGPQTTAYIIPDSVKLKYLRTPLPLSLVQEIDCELPQHTHEEIVAMTISSILEGISDPRFKTHMNELVRQE